MIGLKAKGREVAEMMRSGEGRLCECYWRSSNAGVALMIRTCRLNGLLQVAREYLRSGEGHELCL